MANKKIIVVTQNMDFYPNQIERLKSLGDATFYDDVAETDKEWVERCKEADIVCSGKFGLKKRIYEIKNAFFSLPFVGVGWLDKEKLKGNNITVSYCPGCNKEAVSEWVVGMIFNLFRRFPEFIRMKRSPKGLTPKPGLGFSGKKICILGKGNVGNRVGKVCEALDMDVSYFRRGDDLSEKVKGSDVVIDSLGGNETTEGLLNEEFFDSMKKGSFFISVTGQKIVDLDALLKNLDNDNLAGAAYDSGGLQTGNVEDPTYQKLLKNEKLLLTPHIAFLTDVTARKANNMMIDNIESWIKGKPINLVNL